jgi:hypothetical protein
MMKNLSSAVGFAGLVFMAVAAHASDIRYTTVTGYFLQDETSTDPSKFDYVSARKLGRGLGSGFCFFIS